MHGLVEVQAQYLQAAKIRRFWQATWADHWGEALEVARATLMHTVLVCTRTHSPPLCNGAVAMTAADTARILAEESQGRCSQSLCSAHALCTHDVYHKCGVDSASVAFYVSIFADSRCRSTSAVPQIQMDSLVRQCFL